MQPYLSILIPSIPSRFSKALDLYHKINDMVGDKHIEVLMLTDNKKRSIGAKRNALKNISIGKYFMFVDDDDVLLSLNEIYDHIQQGVDVITFKQRCTNADGSEFIVTFGLGNPVEHSSNGLGGYTNVRRPPFHVCVWHEKFKHIDFADVNYSEDWQFVQAANAIAASSAHIDKILYSYNFNSDLTEASTENNAVWSNPNPGKRIAKRAIVNLVTPSERYVNGQNRLRRSLEDKFPQSDSFFFLGEGSVSAEPHSLNPYSFKVHAIEYVRNLGYDQILWLDASLVAVKDVSPVFDWLTEKGIFLEEAGHWAGTWCNDRCLTYFGLSREEAMQMPMFSAGFCGFDFKHSASVEFFAAWKESMRHDCFKGSWKDHRHDMSAGSIIANKMGLVKDYSFGGQFFSYIGPAYSQPKETAVFHLIGL